MTPYIQLLDILVFFYYKNSLEVIGKACVLPYVNFGKKKGLPALIYFKTYLSINTPGKCLTQR